MTSAATYLATHIYFPDTVIVTWISAGIYPNDDSIIQHSLLSPALIIEHHLTNTVRDRQVI